MLASRNFVCSPPEIDDCRVHETSQEAARWCRERLHERSDSFGTEFERDGEELILSL